MNRETVRQKRVEIAISVPVSDPNAPSYWVTPGDYSGVVELDLSGGDVCTGTLLTSGRHILTAAHCFETTEHTGRPTLTPNARKVTAIFHLRKDTAAFPVEAIFVYPEWQNLESSNGDLAIVQLFEQAPEEAQRYELYRGDDEVGQVFTRVGFGSQSTGQRGEVALDKDDLTPVMRFGQNQYDALGEVFNEPDTAPESYVEPGQQLVYDFDSGKAENDAFGAEFGWPNLGLGDREIGSSRGDSGGPAFIDGKIAGISSTGLSPDQENIDVTWPNDTSFGEYFFDTRVSAFTGYIDQVVAGDIPQPTPTPSNIPSLGLAAGVPLTIGAATWALVAKAKNNRKQQNNGPERKK